VNLSDRATALIRTWMPIWIGSLITLALGQVPAIGTVLDNISTDWRQVAAGAATAVVISGWYALTQQIQRRWPVIGKYLTGSSKLPTYAPVTPSA